MSCEVFSLTILLLESPEKRSIAIAPAVQFKKFYRTCSAMGVFLISRLVGLSTSDRILNFSVPQPLPPRKATREARGRTTAVYRGLVSHRTNMVRRLAAVAYKPQCSGTTPPMVKALT